MEIAFGQHRVRLQSWQTRDEMEAFLAGCDSGRLVLGEDAEGAVSFYSAAVYLHRDGSLAGRFGVGIWSEEHGLLPSLLLNPEKGLLVFGFNREVVGIGFPEGMVRFRVVCYTLFHRFIPISEPKSILLLDEIGVISITEEGVENWRFYRDIIVSWSIADGKLRLDFMDEPSVTLALKNGTPVPPCPP